MAEMAKPMAGQQLYRCAYPHHSPHMVASLPLMLHALGKPAVSHFKTRNNNPSNSRTPSHWFAFSHNDNKTTVGTVQSTLWSITKQFRHPLVITSILSQDQSMKI
eukprot:scaffold14291_cov94-Attheya_sp.AAC.1